MLWRVALTVPDPAGAEAATLTLDAACSAVSAFETPPEGSWRIEGLSRVKPDRVALETMLALAWSGRADAPPAIAIEPLPPRDWVSENQAGFPPIAAGRYFIHGSHFEGRLPPGRVGLLIDAATAFGTGEHATTRGCLLALDGLARQGRRRRVLDMGTGTGILAIAAAKTWRRRVEARDVDAESVRVARHNARRNGMGRLVSVRCSDGYGDRPLWRTAPYDLVFANILARPLIEMARDLERALDADGVAILSGLLARHEIAVLAAHRRVGLRLVRRIAIDGWHTLIVARGSRDSRPSPVVPARESP